MKDCEEFLFPVRVALSDGDIRNTARLTDPKRKRLCTVHGKGYIVLDFGKETVGGLRFVTGKVGNFANVRIRFGESLGEAMAQIGEKGTTNDHSVRDFHVSLAPDADQTYGMSAFRFARIDFLSPRFSGAIAEISVRTSVDDRPAVGSFTCSDPLLNTIYETAVRTVRYNIQNGYLWDGVKRDRLVWIGDLYPSMRACLCVFGDTPEIDNSLTFAELDHPIPGWANNFPTYSLWWMVILAEDYAYSGDKEKFRKHIPYLLGTIDQEIAHIRPDGTVKLPLHFIDWPTHYVRGGDPEKKKQEDNGVAYLMRFAFQKIRPAMVEFGLDTAKLDEAIARLASRKPRVRRFKQIAALGILAGDKRKSLRDVILDGGAHGLSTFMSYPIGAALCEFRKNDEALVMLREYYGGMISMGATTFWEDFDINWLKNAAPLDRLAGPGETDIHGDNGAFCYVGYRHSLCHAWSSGIIPFLFESVLGIRSVGVGSKEFTVDPHLGDLSFAKGDYPTPHGVIHISVSRDEDGKVSTAVVAPAGVTVRMKGEKD